MKTNGIELDDIQVTPGVKRKAAALEAEANLLDDIESPEQVANQLSGRRGAPTSRRRTSKNSRAPQNSTRAPHASAAPPQPANTIYEQERDQLIALNNARLASLMIPTVPSSLHGTPFPASNGSVSSGAPLVAPPPNNVNSALTELYNRLAGPGSLSQAP